MKRIISSALFTISGVQLGACIYVTCMKGIGMGSSPAMAPLFPIIGIIMYVIFILMITDSQKANAKLITSIASLIVTCSAMTVALLMEDY
ncbi:hypothetical protein P4C99_15430 [Pontiellaceae bacterium B1224]|nr:hypothetical protein [Pontiellaceae bacterium B1224]